MNLIPNLTSPNLPNILFSILQWLTCVTNFPNILLQNFHSLRIFNFTLPTFKPKMLDEPKDQFTKPNWDFRTLLRFLSFFQTFLSLWGLLGKKEKKGWYVDRLVSIKLMCPSFWRGVLDIHTILKVHFLSKK